MVFNNWEVNTLLGGQVEQLLSQKLGDPIYVGINQILKDGKLGFLIAVDYRKTISMHKKCSMMDIFKISFTFIENRRGSNLLP